MTDPVRLLEITDVPIDVAAVYAAVGDRHAGGISLFVGTVRDHDHGQSVVGLDYSAHPSAVVVAVACAHRNEAFTASRALIDDLKATVPIWKHQRFSDGSEEWVGTP